MATLCTLGVSALLFAPSTAFANEFGMRAVDHQSGQSAYRGVHASLTWTNHFSGLGSPNFFAGSVLATTSDANHGAQAGVTQTNNNTGDDCISDTNQQLIAYAETELNQVYTCNVGAYQSNSDTKEFVTQRDDDCGTCWGGWIGTSRMISSNIQTDTVFEVRAFMEVEHPNNAQPGAFAQIDYGESTNWARTGQIHSDPSLTWTVITGGFACDFSTTYPTCGSPNNGWSIGSLPDPFLIKWVGS